MSTNDQQQPRPASPDGQPVYDLADPAFIAALRRLNDRAEELRRIHLANARLEHAKQL